MREHEQAFVSRGARLVFVGNGTPAMAASFRDAQKLHWPVLSDEARQAFAAAGLKRGVLPTLHWRTVGNGLRALWRGFRQSRMAGDPWQQGGASVIGADGEIRCTVVDRAGGDPLDVDALLRACG